jgi:phosphoserine phosphatase
VTRPDTTAERFSSTRNCREALTKLRTEGLVIAIISGGISEFIEVGFPDYREYIDFLCINELIFSPQGMLEGLRPTAFDFQGKAEALEMVCERVQCSPAEAVFVGDHFNDEEVMLRVDKAIAYPPQNYIAKSVSNISISEDNLMAIMPHSLVE